MRVGSFSRSIAGLVFLLLFVLTAFARPALAQSDEASSPDVKHPKLEVSPKALAFGEIVVGLTSPSQTITLTNNSGSFAIPITNIRVKLPFIKVSTTCTTGISVDSSCDILIAFKPTATGKVRLGKGVTISGAFKNSPVFIKLEGTGVSGPTPTPTGSPLPTPTATSTSTSTATATSTATSTATATLTATATSTATVTSTATATSTSTSSNTPTATATLTATSTSTATSTATATSTSTSSATATSTSTSSSSATATPTPTVTATATATGTTGPTATATTTATATSTATATASATATGTTPTATATSTPTAGPQAGDVLIAGGDTGGLLSGFIPLSTSTNSTAGAEIYEALSDAFGLVGSLNTAREATATALVLPNGKTLVAGGSHCGPKTYGPGGLCGSSSFSGFQCDAQNTAELYTQTTSTTGSFTLAGAGSGGHMTTARSGATATLITGSGTSLDGKVLITGGSSGSSFLSLSTPPPGCAPFGQVAQNTAEIYDPAADTFTATGSIPGCTAGTAPPTCTTGLPSTCNGPESAITSASESGTTVTITSASNPTGVLVGSNVTVTGVSVTGYNGIFAVTAIPTSTTFQYTAASGLGAGTGGFAAAGTAQCGLVDADAALLNNGKVLIAGGDYIVFLGQSSPQAFLFNPSTATFSQTVPMNVARELPGIVKLPNGDILLAGGLTGAAAACAATPATPTAFTTNSSAEVYDPTVPSWTLTTGSSATPGAAGGMTVKRIAAGSLFTTGTDSGLAIFAGGIDAETTNGSTPNFPTCESTTNIHQTTQTATDLYDPTTTAFTATGALHQSRGGYGFAILGSSAKFPDDLVVVGGECAVGSLASAAIGSAEASTLCGSAAETDYYELFSPSTGLWTVGASAPASTPANSPASALLQ